MSKLVTALSVATLVASAISFATPASATAAAAPAKAKDPVQVSFGKGVLVIKGTTGSDLVRLTSRDNGALVVQARNRPVKRSGAQATVRNVKAIKVYLGAGTDLFDVGQYVPAVTVWAGDGPDIVHAGSGNDTLFGQGGRDSLDGGNGNDTIQGGIGNDRLEGGNGIDRLFGESGDDRVHGGAHDDLLWGSSGKDALWGGPGDDRSRGGVGNDTYYAYQDDHAEGRDVFGEAAGQGVDRVYYNGADDVTFTLASSSDQVNGTSTVRLLDARMFEGVHGGDGADVLIGTSAANALFGGNGDDTLTGAGGADVYGTGNGTGVYDEIGHEAESFGTDAITDFGNDDIVNLWNNQRVFKGLRTVKVLISGPNDDGSYKSSNGRTFRASDFD